VIHYNWRGLAEASSWSNGNPADLELGAGIRVAWPAGQGVYLQRGNNPNVGQDVTWIGSLPANGQGDAGLVYRRNRFFDPASGRFTQEDPIGLGGGLNLYGFGAGDPLNFNDPFGLCYDKESKKERDCEVKWSKEASNRKISPLTGLTVQNLADKANVDLTLSSGFRSFTSCTATLHACGTAVDISEINGHDIGKGSEPSATALPFVKHLQNVLGSMENVQENLGPAGLFRSNKSGQPQAAFSNTALQNRHFNHVHAGFRRSVGSDPFLDPLYRTLLRK